MSLHISISRGGRKKKKGNPRSQMLRVIMKHFSDEALQSAIVSGDVSKFKESWAKIGKKIEEEIRDK